MNLASTMERLAAPGFRQVGGSADADWGDMGTAFGLDVSRLASENLPPAGLRSNDPEQPPGWERRVVRRSRL
jgi:hypothetical protein